MADMAAKARAAAVHFECKKDGLRQTQAGEWKLTLTVIDLPALLMTAGMGTRFMAALVEIADDETPVERPPAESEAPRETRIELDGGAPKVDIPKPVDSHRSEQARERYLMQDEMQRAVTRASLLCKDERFIDFMLDRGADCAWLIDETGEHWSARALREQLRIKSRSEIAGNERAFRDFLALETAYHQSQGLLAEKRS